MHLLQKGRVSEVALEHIDPVRKLVKVAKSSELFRSIGKWGINAVRNRRPNYICTAGRLFQNAAKHEIERTRSEIHRVKFFEMC